MLKNYRKFLQCSSILSDECLSYFDNCWSQEQLMPKRKQIKSLSNASVKHKRLSSAPLTEFNPIKSRTMRNQNVKILETPVKSLR